MINSIIANYQILEKIGEGGMGTVYMGLDLTLERPVAVKVLHSHLLSDQMVIDRFRSEAKTLANLNHPCLATLYNFIQYDDTYCMVMEYVEGKTLTEVLKQEGSLSQEKAIDYAIQILTGLQHAHEQGVIHRDVKPSNVIVTSEGNIKVMDFGIARIIGSQRLTRTGTIIGTIEYMAPEQIKGSEGDEAADIYAVGTLLCELLSGSLPFASHSEFDLLQRKVTHQPISLSKLMTTPSSDLTKVVSKALHRDPKKRYQSCQKFTEQLATLIEVTPIDHSSHNRVSNLSALSKRTFLYAAVAIAVLVSSIILGQPWIKAPNAVLLTEIQKETRPLEAFKPQANTLAPTPIPVDQQAGFAFVPKKIMQTLIDSLFDQAIVNFELDQWMMPKEENAYALCQNILDMDPNHREAAELLNKMAIGFELQGDQYVQKAAYQDATAAYEHSLKCAWSERVLTKKNQLALEASVAFVAYPNQRIEATNPSQPGPPKANAERIWATPEKKKSTSTQIKSETKVQAKKERSEPSKIESATNLDQSEIEKKSEVKEEKLKESTPTSEAKKIFVGKGQEVHLSLNQSINAQGKVAKNDQIVLTVMKAVIIQGRTLIQKGGKALGVISQVKSSKNDSKTSLEVRIQSVETSTGINIPLKASTFQIQGKNNRPAYFSKGQAFVVKTAKDHRLIF